MPKYPFNIDPDDNNKMPNKLQISKVDARATQIICLAMTAISMIPISITLIIDFTTNTFIVFLFGLMFNIACQYWAFSIWNVWYQDGLLHFVNIYHSRSHILNEFNYIEMTSAFGNNYRLYLNNGDKYNFRIKPTDDVKLLSKKNDQFFARKLTAMLRKIRDNAS